MDAFDPKVSRRKADKSKDVFGFGDDPINVALGGADDTTTKTNRRDSSASLKATPEMVAKSDNLALTPAMMIQEFAKEPIAPLQPNEGERLAAAQSHACSHKQARRQVQMSGTLSMSTASVLARARVRRVRTSTLLDIY